MTAPLSPGSPSAAERPAEDRLDSWKEIAAHMRRDVTTVQRWEKREGMPVHRHVHRKMGSVYAFKVELDAWARSRGPALLADSGGEPGAVAPAPALAAPAPRGRARGLWIASAAVAVVATLAVWTLLRTGTAPANPLAGARFRALTDFDGTEQAAAISRDGRTVAFLSDRDGQTDVWVTQVDVGQYYNLTHGSVRELVNPSIRTLGFSPDGTLVTFWARQPDARGRPAVGVWSVPVLGGPARPYLEGAPELDWSADGRLAYHAAGPGDPIYVRDPARPSEAREVFSAAPGLHSHFPLWSPDRAFIYFVMGSVPDRMDIWRIRPTGESPERITTHDSSVSHPVFLDQRTLLYLASDAEGGGPWIWALDTGRPVPRRVSFGIERYASLAASADGRRVVATLARPRGTLWRVPLDGTRADWSLARRIALTTGHGSSPRFGGGRLFYVSSRNGGEGIWQRQGDVSAEVWSAPDARVVGGPAVARDGARIAFSVRRDGATRLYVANADGTSARVVQESLELQGAPAWTPDGRAITVASVVSGVPRLFRLPLDGRPPEPLAAEYSVDPAWSPDGDLVAFSGPDIGTTFEVKAVRADGSPASLPPLTLTRGSRHLAFLPGRRSLAVLRGELQRKNVWRIDLDTGAEHQVTDVGPDFVLRDFDVSPDGREMVLERVQERSDIVLMEVPKR